VKSFYSLPKARAYQNVIRRRARVATDYVTCAMILVALRKSKSVLKGKPVLQATV
jgi:hypothetical protein